MLRYIDFLMLRGMSLSNSLGLGNTDVVYLGSSDAGFESPHRSAAHCGKTEQEIGTHVP